MLKNEAVKNIISNYESTLDSSELQKLNQLREAALVPPPNIGLFLLILWTECNVSLTSESLL